MTISSTTVKNSYSGNGTLDTFNYTFKVFADADLQVIIRDASATETVKNLTTHYTVTGAGSASGGTVVFTAGNIPTATETVVIRRASPQTQAIDYIANDPFPAESHEEGLDRSMMAIQQLQEEVDRSIKLSRTNTMNNTEFTIGDTDRANKVFGFDSAGELVVTQELGTFRGDWSASTAYAVRDLVKDTSTNNIFICLTAHTSSGSQPLTTNADSAKWSLLVDAASATTSATNAANSASAAATSESNAATSESNAATSEANAAASYDDFDDRYLGAKASNPTVDNDGNALIDGALYFDTTNNVMKVYDLGNTTWRRTTPTTAEQTNINTVSGISSNVTTVANNDTNVTTVATNISSVNTVATNINDVIKVADDLNEAISEVETVANDLNEATSEIEVVANNITNVNTVGTNISNVNTVAGISSDVTTVANDGTDIGTVATNISNVNTVAGNNTNITTVAGNNTNITTVAGISSDVTTVANDTADIGTVASDISNVNTVAGSIANVNTVATNVSDVNNFADRYRVQAGEPSVDNDEGDLVYDTNANAVKVYNGTSFDTIQQGITDVAPTRHSIRPSLNLDFANSKVLDPRITFTRGSNATYYDGYTSVKAEENGIYPSTNLSSSPQSAGVILTHNVSGISAPDGTETASYFVPSASSGLHYSRASGGISSPSLNTPYTGSFFAKANGYDFVVVQLTSGTSSGGSRYAITVDLTNGTIGGYIDTENVSNVSSTATSVGNGWYRISLTASFNTGNASPRAILYVVGAYSDNLSSVNPATASNATPSFTGDGSSGVYVWGFQVEQRDSVTAYTPTTTSPITKYQPALQTAGNNVARFDHNPTTGESLGLLIEEQRTNLQVRSEEFDNASWIKLRGTITENKIIAPDGTLTGDHFVCDTTTLGNSYYVYDTSTISSGATTTASCYIKKGSDDYARIVSYDNGANGARQWFNIANGTVASSNTFGTGWSVASASIEDAGNGWYRCIATFNTTGTAFVFQIHPAQPSDLNGNVTAYVTNGFIWGAQVEKGSFPTSYIKTTGSQVTRSAENVDMNNIDTSDWFKQGEGTLFLKGLKYNQDSGWFVGLHDGTLNNRVTIIDNPSLNGSRYTVRKDNVTYFDSYPNQSVSKGDYLNTIISYKRDDFSATANGLSNVTDTSGIVPIIDTLTIGRRWDIGINRLSSTIKKISFYPKALTDNEIIDLTEE